MHFELKQMEAENMKRVYAVFTHSLYRECLTKNEEAEKNREYCVHDVQHFLDVARLAYIFSLERKYDLSKEMIYITALLHDIGRYCQYQKGIPHEKAGSELAERILTELKFSASEIRQVTVVIENHRGNPGLKRDELAEVIYDADKISRACFKCNVRETCNWDNEKKNLTILW